MACTKCGMFRDAYPRNLIGKFERKKREKERTTSPFPVAINAIWNVVRKRGQEGLVPVIINREIGVIRIFALEEDGPGGRRDDRFLYNMGCFANFSSVFKKIIDKRVLISFYKYRRCAIL